MKRTLALLTLATLGLPGLGWGQILPPDAAPVAGVLRLVKDEPVKPAKRIGRPLYMTGGVALATALVLATVGGNTYEDDYGQFCVWNRPYSPGNYPPVVIEDGACDVPGPARIKAAKVLGVVGAGLVTAGVFRLRVEAARDRMLLGGTVNW